MGFRNASRGCAAFARLGCLLAAFVSPSAAQVSPQQQTAPPGLESIPYDRWMREGERTEIPWRLRVTNPVLSFHQRMRASVIVTLSSKKLQKKSVERDLALLVKLADPAGRWIPGAGLRQVKITEPIAKRTDLEFRVPMLLQPGEYSAAIILYDRVTGERSVARRPLRVREVPNDALREADDRLPVVEFPAPTEEAEVIDASYLPEIRGRLDLPVRTGRRVQVEVLANFSASEQYSGSKFVQSRNFSILLPTLKVLSQMDLANGSLRITALDLDRQAVFFQQQNVRGLDWPRLRQDLGSLRSEVVDVRQLQARRERAAFFREALERRLNARSVAGEAEAAAEAPANGEPHRVFIVIGGGILFPRGSDLNPVTLNGPCDCSVYYIQYRAFFGDVWDELHRIIKPLRPDHFVVENAADMRKALGAILEDLRAK